MHNETLDLRYDRRQAPDLIDRLSGPVNGDLTGESTHPMDGVALTSGIDFNFVENNLMNIRYREDHLEGDNILNRNDWPDNAAFHSRALVLEAQKDSTYSGPNRPSVFYSDSREPRGTVWPLQQCSHFNCGNPAIFLPRQRRDTVGVFTQPYNVPLDLCLECATASLNTGTWPRYRAFNSGRPLSEENARDDATHYNQYEIRKTRAFL
jgi:hypothetical protein